MDYGTYMLDRKPGKNIESSVTESETGSLLPVTKKIHPSTVPTRDYSASPTSHPPLLVTVKVETER